jgi:nucleoside triphosphate diphosphatase
MAKIREELDEVEHELAPQARSGPAKHTADPNSPGGIPTEELVNEIGDLLFAVVNLARKAGVQAGPALDRANRKFRERFEQIEQLADDRGIELETAGLEVLDGLWDEAKAAGRRGGGAATSVTSKES